MRKLLLLFIAALTVTAGPGWAAAPMKKDAKSAEAFVREFYQEFITHGFMDLPNPETLKHYAHYFSPSLVDLFLWANETEDRVNAKEEGPPALEGDIMSSNVEGVSALRSTRCRLIDDRAHCTNHVRYLDTYYHPDAPPYDWTDGFELIWTSLGWRLNNVYYGGHWGFSNHGNLRNTLRQVAREEESANLRGHLSQFFDHIFTIPLNRPLSGKALAQLAPYLTSDLRELLAGATRPGHPALFPRALFAHNPTKATGHGSFECNLYADKGECSASLYRRQPHKKGKTDQELILLVKAGKDWKIDDIEYNPAPKRRSLRQLLADPAKP